eukprot:TRINITY_DN1810_c0_g1_i2.p1 TRINITY_DN1810_c0_g1~~TRINITY_DN1810_c0_g1_i2.p1  ORF type:complete len:235 (-),score=35.31 TRINITY_DN1810_c0_g1_i2:362-1066(-)
MSVEAIAMPPRAPIRHQSLFHRQWRFLGVDLDKFKEFRKDMSNAKILNINGLKQMTSNPTSDIFRSDPGARSTGPEFWDQRYLKRHSPAIGRSPSHGLVDPRQLHGSHGPEDPTVPTVPKVLTAPKFPKKFPKFPRTIQKAPITPCAHGSRSSQGPSRTWKRKANREAQPRLRWQGVRSLNRGNHSICQRSDPQQEEEVANLGRHENFADLADLMMTELHRRFGPKNWRQAMAS